MQYSSLCHPRFNFLFYYSVSYPYRRRVHSRWRSWISLWMQLHGHFVNATAPGRFACRWLSAHPRSGRRARSAAASPVQCCCCCKVGDEDVVVLAQPWMR